MRYELTSLEWQKPIPTVQSIDATVKRSGKAVLERNLAAISSEAEGGWILWFTNNISEYNPQFHVLKEILAEIFTAA